MDSEKLKRNELYKMEKNLKELAILLLSDFNVIDDGIGIMSWSKFKAHFLRFCIDEKIITKHETKMLVLSRLRQIAKICYREHIEKGTEPDHVSSPEAFSYGLKNLIFSTEEIEKIQFDDKNFDEFIRISPNNFHEVILERLLEYE